MYTSAKARNFISVSDDSTGLAQRIGLVPSLLCAVLIMLAVFACVILRMTLSDKEKEV